MEQFIVELIFFFVILKRKKNSFVSRRVLYEDSYCIKMPINLVTRARSQYLQIFIIIYWPIRTNVTSDMFMGMLNVGREYKRSSQKSVIFISSNRKLLVYLIERHFDKIHKELTTLDTSSLGPSLRHIDFIIIIRIVIISLLSNIIYKVYKARGTMTCNGSYFEPDMAVIR